MAEPASVVGHAARRAGQVQADAIITMLESKDPGLLAALRSDPATALEASDALTIKFVPEAQTDAGCSVAGGYIDSTTPPTLSVALSASAGRRAFTLLHEFAHHLQQTDFDLIELLLAHRDGTGKGLEELACDAFAAEILLPAEQVAATIGAKGPTVDDVVSLWTTSRASRAAVCVRAAQMLRSPGHVLLLDEDGHVAFDAAHGLPPVRRGSDQTAVPLIARARSNGHRAEGELRLRYRDGITGESLHAQCADLGGYLVIVAVTDTVPWKKFAPPARSSGPTGRWRACEHCQHEYSSFETPCAKCKVANCPECGRCNCPPRLAERLCPGCFIMRTENQFAAGSDRCTTCTE